MKTTNTRTCAATIEQLQELHRLTVAALIDRLKVAPTGEHLSVSRAILRDNGLAGMSQTPAERKALQRLYGLLMKRLHEVMTADQPPSAALLQEVRHLLHQQGIGKDLGGAIDKAQALKVLTSTELPFIKH